MIEIRNITPDISIGLLDLRAFSTQNTIASKRELERAGTRFLLSRLLNSQDAALRYTEQNKPFLGGRPEHISISHSHDKLAIILNRQKSTGIDIELLRDKVLRVRHKFLTHEEVLFAGADIEKLIAIWAAKEAMYKWYGLKQLDFSKNLSVKDFDDSVIFGKIETEDFKREFHLVREKIDDYMMVYILDEI